MAQDNTTTKKILIDTAKDFFAKIKLVDTPTLFVTEHYNEVSEYYTVHVELFMTISKRNFIGLKSQKQLKGRGSLYYDTNTMELKQSVDLKAFTKFNYDLSEYLGNNVMTALNDALQQHKNKPIPKKETLIDRKGAIYV